MLEILLNLMSTVLSFQVPTHIQCGKSAISLEVSSLTQSDEEYLSPQEEAMEVGDSPALSKSVHFKEPPSFQVQESQIEINFELK